jgi:hypothetical protein
MEQLKKEIKDRCWLEEPSKDHWNKNNRDKKFEINPTFFKISLC